MSSPVAPEWFSTVLNTSQHNEYVLKKLRVYAFQHQAGDQSGQGSLAPYLGDTR